jgi:hypothetical protein
MSADEMPVLDAAQRAVFEAVADHLIPAAHGMPSARDIVTDARLRFVINARPDLLEPFLAALRPELGDDPGARLSALEAEPDLRAALVSAVVFGYYTDASVRAGIGYPGQEAKTLYSWKVPEYIDEGLIEVMVQRGPTWRDPATGVRAVRPTDPT